MTMHAALNRGSVADNGEAFYFADLPETASDSASQYAPIAGGNYGERNGPNWVAIAIIVGLHVATLVALVKLDIISVHKAAVHNLTVIDISEPSPPPLDQPKPEKVVEKVVPEVVTPVAMVQTLAPPPPMQVTNTPPPPKPVMTVVAPAAPSGPVAVSDLSDPVFRPPFSIPMEVRRKGKGLRTVSVRLTIGLNGQVEDSELASGSGFYQLDDAIVRWCKKWRFSPVIRNGSAVQARANVPISINIT